MWTPVQTHLRERVAAAMKAHAEAVDATGLSDSDGMAKVPDLLEDMNPTRIDSENFHGLQASRRRGSITGGLTRTSGAKEIEIPVDQECVPSPVLPWETSHNVMSGEEAAEGPKREDDQESGKAVVAEEESQEIARANAAPESPIEDPQGDLSRTSPITRESSTQDFNTRRAPGNPPHYYRVLQQGKALPTSDKHGNDSIYVPPNQQAVMPLTYGESSSFQGASGTVSLAYHRHAPGTDFDDLSNSTGQAVMRSQEYVARLAMDSNLHEGENGTDDAADGDGKSHNRRRDILNTSKRLPICSEPPVDSQKDVIIVSNGAVAPSTSILKISVPQPKKKVLVTATQESIFSTDRERNHSTDRLDVECEKVAIFAEASSLDISLHLPTSNSSALWSALKAAFKTTGNGKVQAALDFTIVAGWQAIIQAIFPESINSDLLKLVHLSNKFTIIPGTTPLLAGHMCKSEARIESVTNTDVARP
ncbi:3-oxoacyl-[acyl-carrier-protein] synthase [Serendipita sp. 399]|nr:3-oxoacyl-[acyl-carrier-protein] synthase [Serendipita sp. 399]